MVTSMSRHRSAAGVVAFEDHIYALGGHDGLSIFDSVRILFLFLFNETFQIDTNKKTNVSTL